MTDEVIFQETPGSIRYMHADLIEYALESGEIDIIAHQTNCQGVFGSGFARAIAVNFPHVEAFDQNIVKALREVEKTPAGETYVTHAAKNPQTGHILYVANMYGQVSPGPNTDYVLLRSAIKQLREYLVRSKYPLHRVKIGLPMVGCGVGGGDWDVVSRMLSEEWYDLNFTVFIKDKEIFDKVTNS